MTALGINNPNSKWMREYNGRNGGIAVAKPFNLRDELNRAWTACSLVTRPIEQKKGKWTKAEIELYKKMNARLGEIAEQLEVLNLCNFIQEFDAENLKKAITAFDAETEQMRKAAK
jgi:hypothetical protein